MAYNITQRAKSKVSKNWPGGVWGYSAPATTGRSLVHRSPVAGEGCSPGLC